MAPGLCGFDLGCHLVVTGRRFCLAMSSRLPLTPSRVLNGNRMDEVSRSGGSSVSGHWRDGDQQPDRGDGWTEGRRGNGAQPHPAGACDRVLLDEVPLTAG